MAGEQPLLGGRGPVIIIAPVRTRNDAWRAVPPFRPGNAAIIKSDARGRSQASCSAAIGAARGDTSDTKSGGMRHRHETEGRYRWRRWLNSRRGEIQMRKTSLFAVAAAALILVGVGGWVIASTPNASAAAPTEQIDIVQLTM